MSEGCPKREYTITFGHQLPEDKILASYPIFITNNIEIAAKLFCEIKTKILHLINWTGTDEKGFKFHLFDEPYKEVKDSEGVPKIVKFVDMTQIPLPKYLKEALDNKLNSIMRLHQDEILGDHMNEPKIYVKEITAQIKSLDHIEKKHLLLWILDYLLQFKDLVITKEIQDIPVTIVDSTFENRKTENYVFSYKSESIFVFRFGYVTGWGLPYYNNLMKTFKGITKILNDRIRSEYSSECTVHNYNNSYWYLQDLIRASLFNLDYPGVKN